MKERSLIIFALLSQLAVGLFVTHLVCFIWFLSFAGLNQAIHWCTPGLIAVAGLMVAATIVSFFHLGNPRNAWRAASHFWTSWLSREIILVIVFTGITVLIAGIVGFRLPLNALFLALGGFGALVGIGLVYTMSRIYRQRTVPAWNTWHTLVHFILSSLSMGVAGTSLLLYLNENIPYTWLITIGRVMDASLVLFLLLKIVTLILWLNPATKTGAYEESLALLTMTHRKVLIAYLILINLAILAGGGLFAVSYQGSWPVQIAILCFTVILVYAAGFFGRGLFYIARVREGV